MSRHDSTSENIQEHNYTTEYPLYSFPHPITFYPGAAVALAARLLWVGLSCQSLYVVDSAAEAPPTLSSSLCYSVLLFSMYASNEYTYHVVDAGAAETGK